MMSEGPAPAVNTLDCPLTPPNSHGVYLENVLKLIAGWHF